MSIAGTSPEACARYHQKQAEVASWTHQASTHHSVNTPGWQTPGFQIGVLSPGLSSPGFSPGFSPSGISPNSLSGHVQGRHTTPQMSMARSSTSSRPRSHREDMAYATNHSPAHHDVPLPHPALYQQPPPSAHSYRDERSHTTQNHSSVPPTPLGIYHQSPSSVGSSHTTSRQHEDVPRIYVEPPSSSSSVSSRRTKSSRHEAERSLTIGYSTSTSPQHIHYTPSSTYSLSPPPPGASTRRSGSNKSSSPSFSAYPLSTAAPSPYPPGFVPYPASVSTGTSRSSSSSAIHLLDETHTPRQDDYSQRFLPQSPSVSSTQNQPHTQYAHGYPNSQPPSRAVTTITYPYTGYAPSVASSASSASTAVYDRQYGGMRTERSGYASLSDDDDETVTAVNTVRNTGIAKGGRAKDKYHVVQGELTADILTLVDHASKLALSDTQRTQQGIHSPADPNCPVRYIALDHGTSITVNGCTLDNKSGVRQQYTVYDQGELRASLGMPRFEEVEKQKAEKERKKGRERSRERSRSRKDASRRR